MDLPQRKNIVIIGVFLYFISPDLGSFCPSLSDNETPCS